MNVNRTAAALITRVFALLLVAYAVPGSALAQGSPTSGNAADPLDVNPGYAAYQREMYFLRFPAAREGGPSEMGGHDQIKDKKSQGPGHVQHHKSGPVFSWPVSIPMANSDVPTRRDEMVNDDMFKTFGYPVSDTQFQVIQRYNQNRMLEQAFDPEKIMWASTATAGMQATSAANSAASASVNQAQSAIDFTKKYLTNFTSEAGNRWQKIRDQLFIPMAILLLLPGAVLAQVKAIVSQGSPVLGDTNPFEGILRSIIAIFLIPATFLVINYGIDVSNSITFTIADEYKRIFGSDMYEDAQCAQKRAFPVNPADRNDNAVMAGENPPNVQGNTAWDPYEALTLNLRQYDPCAKIDRTRTPDERVRDAKKITRLMMNGANAGLTGTWNVMCAFQMAFLYYLWCMGPIAAALWVWPMQRLRGALPSWIEGVVTLCFWSLFWNTTVLLMACFRGVGDSGTVIMSALNFLANVCVKYAFDFTALVCQGGASGVSNAVQQAMQGGANAAGGGGAGQGAHGAPGANAGAGAHPGAGTTPGGGTGDPTGAAGLNAALRNASAQNAHSGVFSSASSVPGLTGDNGGMPLSNALTMAGHNPALAANGMPNGGQGLLAQELGLPPGTDGRGGGTGSLFTGGSGDGSFIPASYTSGASPFTFASTAGGNNFLGGESNLSSLSSLSGGNPLGLHMSNGHLQMNPQALHNLQQQLGDPNNPAHRELSAAMQALQNGDPRALQALAQQGVNGLGGMDPQTARAFGTMALDAQQMYAQGSSGFSPQDVTAIQQFASGQFTSDGLPAVGFSSDGTLTNNLTGQPIDFSNTNFNNLSSLAYTSPMSYDSSTPLGTTYDPTTGLPTNQSFAQMISDGSMQLLPTNGLDGMARTLGSDMPSLVDASGVPIASNLIDERGNFQPGFTPTSDVYALNSNTNAPIARFDVDTNTWQATNAQGVPNGITMSSNGDWVAPSGTSGGVVPVTYDNGTQSWYTSNSGGNVVYDQTSGGFATPQGVAVSYDGNTYTAANDSAIRYNNDQNSFVSTTTGAAVQTGNDGNWYASGTNGSVVLNTSDNNLYMAGSGYSANSAVQYSSVNDTYSAAGGQVYYDNAKSTFEVAGSGAPVSYSNGTWYASDTSNQIAYNTGSRQMEAAGSNAALVYNQTSGNYTTPDGQIYYNSGGSGFVTAGGQSVTATGDQWYAASSNYTVAYDQQNQRFEASGTNQPLTYGSTVNGTGWSAAGSNGTISYDTSTGTYSTYNNAPVYFSPASSGDSGTFYASGTNGSVYYDSGAQTWAGAGSGGQPVAYTYDSQSYSWSPAQGGGGQTYQVDRQQAQQQAVYQQQYDQQFAQQNAQNSAQLQQQVQAQQQYAQYQQDQQQQAQQQYAQQQFVDQQQYARQQYVDQQVAQQQYQQQQIVDQQTAQQQYQQQQYVDQQTAQQQYQQQQYADQQAAQQQYLQQQQYAQQQQQYDQQYGQQQQYAQQQQQYGDATPQNYVQAQNVTFEQGGGGGGSYSGGGYAETRVESPSSYGNAYGTVDSNYLASYAAPHEAAYHHEAPIEHAPATPHYETTHHDSGSSSGYQAHTEIASNPTSSADYYSKPAGGQPLQPKPGGGGLNTFVPVVGLRRQPVTPQSKPTPPPPHAQQPPPPQEQPQEGPVVKKGPMELNAKQGGYVTDDEKRKRQQELLRDSWAEYQAQNPEEEA